MRRYPPLLLLKLKRRKPTRDFIQNFNAGPPLAGRCNSFQQTSVHFHPARSLIQLYSNKNRQILKREFRKWFKNATVTKNSIELHWRCTYFNPNLPSKDGFDYDGMWITGWNSGISLLQLQHDV